MSLWVGDRLAGREGVSFEDIGRATLLQTPRRDACPGVPALALARHSPPPPPRHDVLIVICNDSIASLATSRSGPTAQKYPLGVTI